MISVKLQHNPMPSAEYYHILDADSENGVMATPLVSAGLVTITTKHDMEPQIHLLPSDAMTLASMTIEAVREADPDGFDALWETLKQQIRDNVKPLRQ